MAENLPAVQETQETRIQALAWEDAMEEGMATHSSILVWEILCTEEPDGLPSMGLQESWTQLSNQTHACLVAGL